MSAECKRKSEGVITTASLFSNNYKKLSIPLKN